MKKGRGGGLLNQRVKWGGKTVERVSRCLLPIESITARGAAQEVRQSGRYTVQRTAVAEGTDLGAGPCRQ